EKASHPLLFELGLSCPGFNTGNSGADGPNPPRLVRGRGFVGFVPVIGRCFMALVNALIKVFRGSSAHPTISRNPLPRCLALEDLEGRLLASNGPYLLATSNGNDSVKRYDELTAEWRPAEGQTGATFVPSNGSLLASPLKLLFSPDGDLLVDSAEDNDVLRYDGQTGQYLSLFVPKNTPMLQGPTGMIFSPDGQSFYLASIANNIILRFDYANGEVSNRTVFISDPAMAGPAALVFGLDGNLY